MTKEAKGDVGSISASVTKHASKTVEKAEVNLNCSLWIGYEKLIMDCFNSIPADTKTLEKHRKDVFETKIEDVLRLLQEFF